MIHLTVSLAPGSRLGVYEVAGAIGEGSMGQVWRATDTSLGRQAAIKVLPESFASDPDRVHIVSQLGEEPHGGAGQILAQLDLHRT